MSIPTLHHYCTRVSSTAGSEREDCVAPLEIWLVLVAGRYLRGSFISFILQRHGLTTPSSFTGDIWVVSTASIRDIMVVLSLFMRGIWAVPSVFISEICVVPSLVKRLSRSLFLSCKRCLGRSFPIYKRYMGCSFLMYERYLDRSFLNYKGYLSRSSHLLREVQIGPSYSFK